LDEDGELLDFEISPRELALMRKIDSIELPPSFIKKIHKSPKFKTRQSLVCEGFIVTNTFPNNICLLTGNRVIYCTNFSEVQDPEDKNNVNFFMEGFLFKSKKPFWTYPDSSFRIGFVKASKIDLKTSVKISGLDLVGKCFCFKSGKSISRETPEFDPVPAKFLELVVAANQARTMQQALALEKKMLQFAEDFEVQSESFKRDAWWVESLIVPGKHTNYFQ
jgi:hypothetical protein